MIGEAAVEERQPGVMRSTSAVATSIHAVRRLMAGGAAAWAVAAAGDATSPTLKCQCVLRIYSLRTLCALRAGLSSERSVSESVHVSGTVRLL